MTDTLTPTPQVTYCGDCGGALTFGSRFCTGCGRPSRVKIRARLRAGDRLRQATGWTAAPKFVHYCSFYSSPSEGLL